MSSCAFGLGLTRKQVVVCQHIRYREFLIGWGPRPISSIIAPMCILCASRQKNRGCIIMQSFDIIAQSRHQSVMFRFTPKSGHWAASYEAAKLAASVGKTGLNVNS
jgi:hypothetical protein